MNRYITLCALAAMAALGCSALAQQDAPVQPFADVPKDHWAYQAVENLRLKGIIKGYPDSSLRGKRTITRYEAAAALDRIVKGGESLRAPVNVTGTPLRDGGIGPQGARGSKGVRGPAGSEGPRGQAPTEVSEYRAALESMRAELESIRNELESTDTKTDSISRKAREVSKNMTPIRTGK